MIQMRNKVRLGEFCLLNSSPICCLPSIPAVLAPVPITLVIFFLVYLPRPLSPSLSPRPLVLLVAATGKFLMRSGTFRVVWPQTSGNCLKSKAKHVHSQLRNLQMAPVTHRIRNNLCGDNEALSEPDPACFHSFRVPGSRS